MSRVRSAVLALSVLLSLGATCAQAATAPAAPRTWKSGVFSGPGPGPARQFGTWRGSPVDLGGEYVGAGSWGTFDNPSWVISQWAPVTDMTPVFSIQPWPSTITHSWADVASGADNAHWASMGRNLVAAGLDDVVIRLAWEFNGTWYRWKVTTPQEAAQFAEGWRQIVGTLKATPGQHFKFDWCVYANMPGGIDPALAYPGDDYVDTIGMDVYDFNQRANPTPEQRFDDIVNNNRGLAWQADYAAQHGKPIAFTEWGLVYNGTDLASTGNDDPYFVSHMYDWFATHNTAYEMYFDANGSGPTTSEINVLFTHFPMAAALYKQLW